ncbi:type II secretion system inner membrane protein GspF [Bacteriovoracaceae bacterium]|nr:type II secretion system inner membrane protein GspF [Bacteriovoracaceae bacterium]
MPIYNYSGINKTGKEIKGTITVDSMPTAKSKIKGQGVVLISIKEQKSKTASKGISFGGSVSVEDLAMMTRQLATLIKAKIQIVEALGALSDQVDSQVLKIVLSEVKQKVNEGSSLAGGLAAHPRIFNNVYVNMVEAGEASGTLEIVLLRLAEFTEAQMKLKNKIRGAITYPIIMAIFGFLMLNVIFIFVIPKLAKLFKGMKKELPIQTKISIWLSDFLQNWWWAVFLTLFATFFLFKKYINSQSGQRKWHRLILRLPIFGLITKMINVSRFSSTLSTLLSSGVPILVAMRIVKNLVPNVIMKDAIEEAKDAVSEGASLTGPLIASGQYPPLVTHMIKLGEQSGEMEEMLSIIAENYEDQVDSKISGLTSLLEPIMMIGLGGVVAFIIFSIVVPMMELNSPR